MFVGWRVDAGFAHRKVHLVLDYESLKTRVKGYGIPIQVYDSELVEPSDGKFIFPMYEAGVAKFNLYQPSLELPTIKDGDALAFEGEAPPVTLRKR